MTDQQQSKLTFQLPKKLHREFKKAAVLNDDEMSELLREWIAKYVAKSKS